MKYLIIVDKYHFGKLFSLFLFSYSFVRHAKLHIDRLVTEKFKNNNANKLLLMDNRS